MSSRSVAGQLSCSTSSVATSVRPKGMVGAVEHVLGSHHFVAAFKRFEVITHGVNVELAEVMVDGMRQTRCVRKNCGWGSIAFDASRKIGDDTSDVGHDQLWIECFIEQAALDEAY